MTVVTTVGRVARDSKALLTIGLLAVSVVLSAVLIAVMLRDHSEPFDWWTLTQAHDRFPALYEWSDGYGYRYSPLLALIPFPDMGLLTWRVLHLVALAFLPWRMALLTLAFAPFWYDVLHGNTMTFAFVAGWVALSGRTAWPWFLVTLLVPRPLMVPLSVWLVWRVPSSRIPAVVCGVLGIFTLAYPGFLGALIGSGSVTSIDNLAPSALIGWVWVPVGLVLGAWLTWRGRIGLAGLAVSPYVLPYYLIVGLWELADRVGADAICVARGRRGVEAPVSDPRPA